MKLIVRWLLLAAALLLVANIYPGVSVASFTSALIAALVLGLLNTLVRPLLVLLTLPVTMLTLGLFLLVGRVAARGLRGRRLCRRADRLADLQRLRHGDRHRRRTLVCARVTGPGRPAA